MSTTEWLIYAAAVAAMAVLFLYSARYFRQAQEVCRRALEEVHENEIQIWAKGWTAARAHLVAAHPGCSDECDICIARAELISDMDAALYVAIEDSPETLALARSLYRGDEPWEALATSLRASLINEAQERIAGRSEADHG